MKNYYQVLGLEPSCTPEQIKTAFKEYAKHFHPDKHQGNKFFEQKFIEIKEAYDILYNSATRSVHDEYHKFNSFDFETSATAAFENVSSNSGQTNRQGSTNFNSSSTQNASAYTRDVTEEDFYQWAMKKVENNDYYGALSEIGDGMKKFPKSALLECAEGEVQESFGYYWRARKSYRRGFEYGIVEAKAEILRIEALLDNGISIYKKYMFKTIVFCVVGLAIVLVGNIGDLAFAGNVIGTLVNIIGGVIILRGSEKEIPRRLSENFQYYSLDFNIYLLFCILIMLGSAPLLGFILA